MNYSELVNQMLADEDKGTYVAEEYVTKFMVLCQELEKEIADLKFQLADVTHEAASW